MSTTTMENKCGSFEIRQRVKVKGTEVTARVSAILLNEAGTSYQISYWYENLRRVEWVDADEIGEHKP